MVGEKIIHCDMMKKPFFFLLSAIQKPHIQFIKKKKKKRECADMIIRKASLSRNEKPAAAAILERCLQKTAILGLDKM